MRFCASIQNALIPSTDVRAELHVSTNHLRETTILFTLAKREINALCLFLSFMTAKADVWLMPKLP